MFTRKATICATTLLLTACLLVSPAAVRTASAQSSEPFLQYAGWGPRLGLTMDPDQIHGGIHLDMGHLASRVHLRPALEIGFGDNTTLVALNFDVTYRFVSHPTGSWTPYAGGAMGIHHINVDRSPLDDATDTDVGLNLLAGLERPLSGGDSFLTEMRLGLDDSPDFKLTVGWTFR